MPLTQLPFYSVLDKRLEQLPAASLRSLQAERFRQMVRYVYNATPFWRRRLDDAGVAPEDIRGLEDIRSLPFCTKDELQQDQQENPPVGSYAGTDRSAWVRFFATSGTTGQPLRRVYSARDWGYVIDRFRRTPPAGPGDRVVMLGPTEGFLGPTAGAEAMQACGALVIFAGRYDTKRKVELLRELRPAVVNGSSSYLLYIASVAREMGIDLSSLGIRAVVSVGEPGAAVPETRRRLQQGWGCFINDGYGLTEIFPLGGACPHSTALHLPDDLVITEIIDPETGKPVPPGRPGELVLTNLIGDTQPLLRYRTRDIARVQQDRPCACGFSGTLLTNSIEGRVDDMIWFKGTNIFPATIEKVIHDFDELGDEYRILLSGDAASPVLSVQVETRQPGASQDMEERLQKALRAVAGVNIQVEILPAGHLPRPDGKLKSRRVIDRRTSE